VEDTTVKTFCDTVAEHSGTWERLKVSVELLGVLHAIPWPLLSPAMADLDVEANAVYSAALVELFNLQPSPSPEPQTSVLGPAPVLLCPESSLEHLLRPLP